MYLHSVLVQLYDKSLLHKKEKKKIRYFIVRIKRTNKRTRTQK